MQFTKLRLSGFKSFVEATELAIAPGLTGIVGPNGCGKSNLVEALQWVMGESSARRLRGGEMDDVIFGGTADRAARNVAEVALHLDNSLREAPAFAANPALKDEDEIEVERRIARGKGSAYRVNGRDIRARDVQVLFADAASGAQSSALIGQGRIGWLINAKPAERRILLEEAAGIGGLHARRAEAESKLAGVEGNLARLDDVTKSLAGQVERLKKQARQAERYRKLSEDLERAEAALLYRRWRDAGARADAAMRALGEAESAVVLANRAAEAAQDRRAAAQAALLPLREAATEALRRVERETAQGAALDVEAARVAQSLREAARQIEQLDQDIGREQRLAHEAGEAETRLVAERQGLAAARDGEQSEQALAARALAEAHAAVLAADKAAAAAAAEAAAREAVRAQLQKRLHAIEERRARLRRQLAEAEHKSREQDLLAVSPEVLEAAGKELAEAEAAAREARTASEAAEAGFASALAAETAARQPARAAESRLVSLRAECQGLRALVATAPHRDRKKGAEAEPPVLDALRVAEGFETALGAALGDDLMASLVRDATRHWAGVAPDLVQADLPEGAVPLSTHVEAPPELAARLRAVGVVADEATGQHLAAGLREGQRLVTREGAVWRWDGLVARAGAPSAAAIRLAQRNRLAALEEEAARAQEVLAAAEAVLAQAVAALNETRRQEHFARETARATLQRVGTVRQKLSSLEQQATAAALRRQSLDETLARIAAEAAEIDAAEREHAGEHAALPDAAAADAELERLRAALAAAREAERTSQRDWDRLHREAELRRNRLAAIEAELESWRRRTAAAAVQNEVLRSRRAALAAERDALAAEPERLTAARAQAVLALDQARGSAREAATALKLAEAVTVEADRLHEQAAQALAGTREQRVREEALATQAIETHERAAATIRDGFDVEPEALPGITGIDAAATEPAEALGRAHEAIRRDREALGPVNLVAERELAQLTGEMETIRSESGDLEAAVARLRQAIQQINKEGRERLAKAFEAVNGHFETLFTRLFGGGHAHLALIQHENDPLQAGLEIMASPPGKKLQALSLLSGGERALTALALVFAVFLTKPAPICVLDEVDAPLDDANVERFCTLVREIAQRTGTRFLVITHHRVSMARMDRLYGVTMSEKGVSRLVSVELAAAAASGTPGTRRSA